MRTFIFTGNGGSGISLSAAATASAIANSSGQGHRTLLASIGPSHTSGSWFDVATSADTPQSIAPNLDIWSFNVLHRMQELLEKFRPHLTGSLSRITGEELPVLPGLDIFFGIDSLHNHIEEPYDYLVVDAGPHDGLLRALSVPDGFRWFLRLIFGIDRDPGRNPDSLSQALIPANILPFAWPGHVQNARVRLEKLRDDALDPSHTTVRYVLRPDEAAYDEALIALPALQLHGMAIDALVVGPILPSCPSDSSLSAVAEDQRLLTERAKEIWSPRPIFSLPFWHVASEDRIESLRQAGATIYADHPPTETGAVMEPIVHGADEQGPFITLRLPGLPKHELGLTLGFDELVVRAGHFRRHILLPPSLRGTTNIKATRDGEQITVRLRQPTSE
jgi:anion-transporting  ArsA/GET3 family ATPase